MIRSTAAGVACCLVLAMGGCRSGSSASASPGCPDNHEPVAAAKAASGETTLVKVGNMRCPIAPDDEVGDNGMVDAELTRPYNGQTIGFCCPNCPPIWDKMSDQKKAAALKNAKNKDGSRS